MDHVEILEVRHWFWGLLEGQVPGGISWQKIHIWLSPNLLAFHRKPWRSLHWTVPAALLRSRCGCGGCCCFLLPEKRWPQWDFCSRIPRNVRKWLVGNWFWVCSFIPFTAKASIGYNLNWISNAYVPDFYSIGCLVPAEKTWERVTLDIEVHLGNHCTPHSLCYDCMKIISWNLEWWQNLQNTTLSI